MLRNISTNPCQQSKQLSFNIATNTDKFHYETFTVSFMDDEKTFLENDANDFNELERRVATAFGMEPVANEFRLKASHSTFSLNKNSFLECQRQNPSDQYSHHFAHCR